MKCKWRTIKNLFMYLNWEKRGKSLFQHPQMHLGQRNRHLQKTEKDIKYLFQSLFMIKIIASTTDLSFYAEDIFLVKCRYSVQFDNAIGKLLKDGLQEMIN